MTAHKSKWLRLLRYGCLYILITGLLPLLAIFPATQEPWRLFYDVLSWPLDNGPANFTDSDRQLSAIIGGILCGWAWLLYKIAHPEIFNESLRKLMVQSVWVWFILDSAGSIMAGLPLNAASNVIFALVLLVPLRKLTEAK